MKKLVLILMLLVLPCSAFGLEMLNDTAMDDVTGQAGVAIAFDDVQLFMHVERIAWIDADGFDTNDTWYGTAGTSTGSAGAVGLDDFQIDTLQINAITGSTGLTQGAPGLTSIGELGLNFDYDSTVVLGSAQLSPSYGGIGTQKLGLDNYDTDAVTGIGSSDILYRALTIDATNKCPALTTGYQLNKNSTLLNIGGVLIGLPTAEFYIPAMSMTPAFYNVNGVAIGAVNDVDGTTNAIDACNYGTISMEGITFTTLGGWVEIAPK